MTVRQLMERAGELQAGADHEVGWTTKEWREFLEIVEQLDFYRLAQLLPVMDDEVGA